MPCPLLSSSASCRCDPGSEALPGVLPVSRRDNVCVAPTVSRAVASRGSTGVIIGSRSGVRCSQRWYATRPHLSLILLEICITHMSRCVSRAASAPPRVGVLSIAVRCWPWLLVRRHEPGATTRLRAGVACRPERLDERNEHIPHPRDPEG